MQTSQKRYKCHRYNKNNTDKHYTDTDINSTDEDKNITDNEIIVN